MRISLFLAVCATLVLTACASSSTKLVNSTGQVADCTHTGWGWLGAPMALIQHSDCVKRAEAAGYKEFGSPGAPAATSGLPAGPLTMTPTAGAYKVNLPAGWAQAPAVATFELQAINPGLDIGTLVSSAPAGDISDLKTFIEAKAEEVARNLVDGVRGDAEPVKVNGMDAYRVEIRGAAKTGVRLRYVRTMVRTPALVVDFLSWSTESTFEARKTALQAIPFGLEL